jgi:hypothetical protein
MQENLRYERLQFLPMHMNSSGMKDVIVNVTELIFHPKEVMVITFKGEN